MCCQGQAGVGRERDEEAPDETEGYHGAAVAEEAEGEVVVNMVEAVGGGADVNASGGWDFGGCGGCSRAASVVRDVAVSGLWVPVRC